jgi:hypothetical protein
MDQQQDSQENEDQQLRAVGTEVLRHLKEYQPNRYKMLVKSGQLMSYVLQQQEMAERYEDQATNSGQHPTQTWEVIRDRFISLPDLEKPRASQASQADSTTE